MFFYSVFSNLVFAIFILFYVIISCVWTDLVKNLHGFLEAGELHHGVWDLSAPQWDQALVECTVALFVHHLRPRLAQSSREARHGLDADLKT